MAIDYSGYAQSYGGGAAAGAAGQTIGRGLARIPSFQERYGKYRKSAIDEYTKPLMNAFVGDIDNIDLSGYKSAPDAYMDYNESLKAGTGGKGKFFGKRVERKGLIDPKTFVDKYKATAQTFSGPIMEKILKKQILGKKSDIEMRRWVSGRPGLANFILSNVADDPNNPNAGKLRGWATPQKSVWDQFGDLGEYMTTGWTPGGVMGTTAVTAGLTGLTYKYGGDLLKGATKAVNVDPWNLKKSKDILAEWQSKYKSNLKGQGGPGIKPNEMKNLKKNIAKLTSHIKDKGGVVGKAGLTRPGNWVGSLGRIVKGGAIYAGVPIAAQKVGEVIGGEKAGAVTGQTVRTAMSSTVAGIQLAVRKKGTRWLLTQMAKKGGVGLGLRLAAKLGLGAVGGTVSGGAMTAVMAGFAVKDLYDLAKLITQISRAA